jgi:micrococcal nuclease
MIRSTLISLALLAGCQPRAVDGDTLRLSGISIRLVDYDAPELFSPRCRRESTLALRAKSELQRQVAAGNLQVSIVPCATNNYGRLCGRATLSDRTPLASHMILLNLAVPYDGLEQKKNWCQ